MDRKQSPRGSVSAGEGVEIREGARGKRIRIAFYYQGARRRETLDIPVTPANIKYANRLRGEVLNAIERGTFDYAKAFPGSKHARLAGVHAVRPKLTVGELMDEHLAAVRRADALSPSSIGSYARWTKARIKPKFGDRIADEITPPELRAWILDLASELAPKSVRSCVSVLSVVLSQAATDGIIASNPLAPIKLRTLLPRKRKAAQEEKIDPFSDLEIAAILDACPTVEERAFFQFAFGAGMRTGELIAFKWQHVSWATNTLHVQDNVVSGEYGTVEKTTKTDTERDIPILPAAKAALEAMRPASELLSAKTGGYVFLNPRTGQRWSNERVIRDRWTIILRKAGIRYRNPYQTRHTFASRLLMSGEAELLVAKLLGHTTVEMVRRHYGRYIKQPDGIVLRGDYSEFGADLGHSNPPKPALAGQKKGRVA